MEKFTQLMDLNLKNKIIIDRDIFMMETSIQQPAIYVKKNVMIIGTNIY